MANTSKPPIRKRDVFYYRQRQKNRVFGQVVKHFAEKAEREGITKKDIAELLERDPAQVTRWLSSPSNLTLDTISDLLLALGAEMDHQVAPFADRLKPNEMHPVLAAILGAPPLPKTSAFQVSTSSGPATSPKVAVISPEKAEAAVN